MLETSFSPSNLVRALVVAAAAASLAACAATAPPSQRVQFSSATYGVPASPRVVAFGQRVPRGGGRYVVGVPYRVAGRTYVPQDPTHYSEVGLASWYGSNFHGRLTANGEVYDVDGLTAAHPTMPLPSYARVTNLANGRSVVVRVNDRGPYVSNRLIDVSSNVARVLDFQRAGTARVKVDYVGPARMDGLDERLLMASYRAPGNRGNRMVDVALASVGPPVSGAASTPSFPKPLPMPVFAAATPAPVYSRRPAPAYAPQPITVAAVVPAAPRFKPQRPVEANVVPAEAPMVLNPSAAPVMEEDDPLAPLILRSQLASSYASPDRLSAAHKAAADFAGSRMQADLDRAAAAKAKLASAGPVVQIGVFTDAANAAQIAQNFAPYGRIEISDRALGGITRHAVRVIAGASVDPATILTAALAMGIGDARIVSR